jgi:hypothetical protein
MQDQFSAEEWRPVPDWEMYEASSFGRVRRVTTEHVLRGYLTTQGYLALTLSVRSVRRRCLLHQLVAEAFYGLRPTPAHTVNHRNGDKLDNRAANLEWATMAEQHRHARQLHPDQPGWFRGLTAEQAAEVLAQPEISTREWARRLGVNGLIIQRIRRGLSYRWAGVGRDAPIQGLHWHPCIDENCRSPCHFS